ncbi:SIR2 family protein [Pontibacter russatus]|uniref:SIR2 family protein n=1 Tax=Pontibacter russatus TaxID=2694929 RepID=UPI0013797234|nr:SIR2 family protein [Pontibacter russatus]
MKKRDVFLFGAGAVIGWKGPTTNYLTERVRKTGHKIKSGQYITDIIYQALVEVCKLKKDEVNFETIISVVEELIVYYTGFSGSESKLSLTSPFLSPSALLNDIIHIERRENEGEQPTNINYKYRLIFEGDAAPEQHILRGLLTKIISQIMADVLDYSYYSVSKKVIVENEANKQLNDAFARWIKASLYPERVARIYTLNYDRLFKIVLENRGVPLFEGFTNTGAAIEPNAYHRPDLKRLYEHDFSCHYNLHGSASWHVSSLNRQNMPSHEYFLAINGPLITGNGDVATVQIEKGKNIILTPIITGYQKAQKTAITPFKQMQAAFDKDCMFADNLFIVGYSFGDAHINESIRNALKENEELQVTIVDPNFIKGDMYGKLWEDLFSHTNYVPEPMCTDQQGRDLYSCLKGRIRVYTKFFADFLKEVAPLE